MLFNKKFDLVISLGEDCACSSYLRRCKLQDYSYPFDWLTNASFETRCELILNNFTDFLVKENLCKIEKPTSGIIDNNCDYYADKKNSFYFYHDFKTNQPFDSEYGKVKEKFSRRIERLYAQISNAENILFVWWSRDKHQSLENIEKYYKNFVRKFPSKSIYLLIIEYNEVEEDKSLEDNHIIILRYDNISYKQNKHWNEVLGNLTNNLNVFSKIKMNRSIKWHLKFLCYKLLKLLINIVPIKEKRTQLRSELNIKFYKEAL